MSVDDIDRLLLDAWARLSRDERRLRIAHQRRTLAYLRHPPRAWCLALRASDTRLLDHALRCDAAIPSALSRRERELYRVKRPRRGGQVTSETLRDDAARELNIYPERFVFDGAGLRALTAAVWIREPTRIIQAAKMLGLTDAPLRRWVIRGHLQVLHEHGPGGIGVGPGLQTYVYRSGPIDPNAANGRPPDPAWGTAWQNLASRIPLDFMQALVRVPITRTVRGKTRLMGYTWVCPGRLMRDPRNPKKVVFTGCGRTARTLFAPIPVFTLADYLAGRDADPGDPPRGEAASLRDEPDLRSPLHHVPKSFACEHCWQPQRTSPCKPGVAWNLFVAHMSGGLLYGHDIPRPPGAFEGKVRRYDARAHRPPRADGFPLPCFPKPRFVEVTWYNCHLPEEERHLTLKDHLKRIRQRFAEERKAAREKARTRAQAARKARKARRAAEKKRRAALAAAAAEAITAATQPSTPPPAPQALPGALPGAGAKPTEGEAYEQEVAALQAEYQQLYDELAAEVGAEEMERLDRTLGSEPERRRA